MIQGRKKKNKKEKKRKRILRDAYILTPSTKIQNKNKMSKRKKT